MYRLPLNIWQPVLHASPSYCVHRLRRGSHSTLIQETLKYHKEGGQLLTVTGVRPPSRYGELLTDDTGTVVDFAEKPQVGTGMINGGYFVCSTQFLDYLSEEPDCILERAPMERCAQDKKMKAFEHTGFWQCMDTFRDWENLEKMWKSGQAPWSVWA